MCRAHCLFLAGLKKVVRKGCVGGKGFVVTVDVCQFFPAAGDLFMCCSRAVFYLGIGDPWDS